MVSLFVNFEKGEKQFYFFKSHNFALNSWIDALNKGAFEKGAFLVHIDYHSDLSFVEQNAEYDFKENAINFFSLSSGDQKYFLSQITHSNFIVPAFLCGLLKDGLVIHKINNSDYGDFEIESDEYVYGKRKINLGRGVGNIYLVKSNLVGLENLLTQNSLRSCFDTNTNLVLDIDLDYFTVYFDNEQKIVDNLDLEINSFLLKELFNRAKIVTIALEPACCGGEENCVVLIKKMSKIFNLTTIEEEKILDLLK